MREKHADLYGLGIVACVILGSLKDWISVIATRNDHLH